MMVLRPSFGFRFHLKEPDRLQVELQLTNQLAPNTTFQVTLQQVCTSYKPDPDTLLLNDHQPGEKQKLRLWFGSQHQPIT